MQEGERDTEKDTCLPSTDWLTLTSDRFLCMLLIFILLSFSPHGSEPQMHEPPDKIVEHVQDANFLPEFNDKSFQDCCVCSSDNSPVEGEERKWGLELLGRGVAHQEGEGGSGG